jgi:hypothetical protein
LEEEGGCLANARCSAEDECVRHICIRSVRRE